MRLILLSIILFFIATIGCVNCYSQSPNTDEGWLFIGQTKGKEKYYIELEGSLKSADVFGEKEVWVKCIQPVTVLKKGGKKVTYTNTITLTLHEIKCEKKEMRVKQEILYSSKGDILMSSDNMYADFKRAVPGTIGESIVKEACKY